MVEGRDSTLKMKLPVFGCLSVVRSVSRWNELSHQAEHGWGGNPNWEKTRVIMK